MAVGGNGTLLTSQGGTIWMLRNSGTPLNSVTYGEGTFMGVGDGGLILQSGNLINPPVRFESITTVQNGTVRLQARAPANSVMFFEASEDFSTWAPFATVTNSAVVQEISDPSARDFRQRYFRIKLMAP